MFLVGPPMPDRSKVMCQTKRDTPVLQRWRFVGQDSNLPTVKNSYAQRTSKKSFSKIYAVQFSSKPTISKLVNNIITQNDYYLLELLKMTFVSWHYIM
jgi:hypothetical protein